MHGSKCIAPKTAGFKRVQGKDFIVPPCHEEITILHRDEHLLVIDKPSKLLSVPGQNPLNKDSVLLRLKQQWPEVKLVHRLDFGTSGLMLACLSGLSIANLNLQFQNRSVQKQYTAHLAGHVEPEQGVIDLPIARADDFPRQKVCRETGKPAQSHYRVLAHETTASGVDYSRVLFSPITGRTHQLRLHSLVMGHPLLGCDLYNQEVEVRGQLVNSQTLASRLLLHACRLSFEHPVSQQPVLFESAAGF